MTRHCVKPLLAVLALAVALRFQASAQQQQPQASENLTPEQAQALKNLTPEQQEMVRSLLGRGRLAPSGDIRGFVAASLPGNPDFRDVALPGAQVFVQRSGGEKDEESVASTNGAGRFRITPRLSGSYNVCATLQGFTTECSSTTVVDHNVALPKPISLKPIGTAIRGCVTLKDGTPAVRAARSLYETEGSAEVSAVNAAGKVLAGPVPVNAAGCYVLAGVPSTTDWSVAARYEEATARQAVPTGTAVPNGSVVNVVFSNAPPTITAFAATLNGREVSLAPPGSTVEATVSATSPENYPLHYSWADGTGGSLPGDQASQQWHLPKTDSLNFLYVEVSDGHGGVARASLSIAPGPASNEKQAQPQTAPVSEPQRFKTIPVTPQNPIALLAKFKHPSQTFIDPTAFMTCIESKTKDTCKGLSDLYYKTIGVFDAAGKPTKEYANFKTWKRYWGFSDDPTKPGPNETRAVYYNNGELQFGRDMQCLSIGSDKDPKKQFVGAVLNVCYVTNFSDASGVASGNPQTAVVNAEKNSHPIAAVAMLGIDLQFLLPTKSAKSLTFINQPYVEFIVFAPPKKGDATLDDFVPSTKAVLDSEGPKAVPGVCQACHGGTFGRTGNLNNSVGNARFLAFDTPSYIFDQKHVPFSRESQREAFRKLNVLVRNIDTETSTLPGVTTDFITSQTIRDLIAGWYDWCGGVDKKGCHIDDVNHPFIPNGSCASVSEPATCGWTKNSSYAKVYQQVPRVYCQTCHVAHSDAFDLQNFLKFKESAELVCSFINSDFMPFAEVPYDRFWSSSTAQSELAKLLGDLSASCKFEPPPKKKP